MKDAMQRPWAADNLDPDAVSRARGTQRPAPRQHRLFEMLSRPTGADFNDLSDAAEMALQTFVANTEALGENAGLLAHCMREALDDAISGRQHRYRNVYAGSWDDIRAINAKTLAAAADAKAKNYKACHNVRDHIHGAATAVGEALETYVAERTRTQGRAAAGRG